MVGAFSRGGGQFEDLRYTHLMDSGYHKQCLQLFFIRFFGNGKIVSLGTRY